MEAIRKFYSELKFPGPYTIHDLDFYKDEVVNPFLKPYDDSVEGCRSVLDVGCGSGFILNMLARRHPNVLFHAVDFSDSIDYAEAFSKEHNINNIVYYKSDFLTWHNPQLYDVVISNGVLHHIPRYLEALQKIKSFSTNKIVIGLYNRYGKLAKKIFPVRYKNNILFEDQEMCPFEMAFSDRDVRSMFTDYKLLDIYPSSRNNFVDLHNLFNYKNGGLTVYTWKLKD